MKFLFFQLLNFCLIFFTTNALGNEEVMKKTETKVINRIFQVDINSSINPATFEHLKKSVKKVSNSKDALLLIKMTTPGGLVSTTKEILNLIGESEFPVVVWIAPEGSSATSAGAIIASGAHYLYMSDGTNIGAATPITMSGDIGEKPASPNTDSNNKNSPAIPSAPSGSDVRAKAVNDLVALVKSLSETRGRDATSYALMIEEAKSYTAKEAEEKKIIDKVANHLDEIYNHISSKSIKIKGIEYQFTVSPKVELILLDYSLADKLLNTFSSPEVAYILFLLGAALIYFELQAPGGFIAGGFGLISLLLAGIGFHVLPVNFGGIGLLLLSFVLFILEAYIPSFGLLALAGVAALVFGSLILFESPDSLIALDHLVMVTTISSIIFILGLISFYLYKTRLQKNKNDFFAPIGHEGKIKKILDKDGDKFYYMAKINGVLWKVTSVEQLNLEDTISVQSESSSSLVLIVSKKS
jgi:membrane-bound serine protease (ClpP class)